MSAFENVVCATDQWIRFDGFIETADTVLNSLSEYYPNDDAFPCSDVTVLCSNDTVSRSCSMTHLTTFSGIDSLFDYEDVCYLINVQDLQKITCNGLCPASPTSAPTSAPTNAPTYSPSAAPSAPPTMDPTADPTSDPTADPTIDPTADPTAIPTVDPTSDPTKYPPRAPTTSPTMDPSQSPTISPTDEPTKAPSISPTAPTKNPTTIPTVTPTVSPTEDPTNDPTIEPTRNPTSSPTNAPTDSPTDAPTHIPSVSPTFFPTAEDQYDHYIEMEYQINGLVDSEMKWIADSVFVFSQNLSDIIESGLDNDQYLEYRYVEVNVSEINGEAVDDLLDLETEIERLSVIKQNEPSLVVTSYTNCSVKYCLYIIEPDTGSFSFNESAFEEFVTVNLREYFDFMVFGVNANGGSVVDFNVSDYPDEPQSFAVSGDDLAETEADYYVIGLMIISGMICATGFLALCYENGKITKLTPKVDTSIWTAFLALGLQFWDFVSDLLLCFELWTVSNLFEPGNRRITICAIGSAVFLVVPYLSNLRVASKIKQYVKENKAASDWCVMSSDCIVHFLRFLHFLCVFGAVQVRTPFDSVRIVGGSDRWLLPGNERGLEQLLRSQAAELGTDPI